MPNPYAQVALTYIRRPFHSLKQSLLILGFLFFFVIIFFVDKGSQGYQGLRPFQLMLLILFYSYLAAHMKEQFTNSRASLTPGFRKVHGIVASAIALALSVLLPGLMAPSIGWQSFGFISITTVMFGAMVWSALRSMGTITLIILCGWLSTFAEPVRSGMEQIVLGRKPVHALIFTGIGILLSISGIIRLIILNEEMPDYHLNIQIFKNGQGNMSELQRQKMEKYQSRGWISWCVDRRIIKLIYHAGNAADSYWSRIRRWNYLIIDIWIILIIAIILNLTFMLMGFFIGKSMPVVALVLAATLVSATLAIALMIVKNRFFSRDIMMPITRDNYLKQFGISSIINQFITWGVFMAVSILCMFIMAIKPGPELLAYIIFYSLMMQIWAFGVAFWSLSFRYIALTVFILYVTVLPSTFAIFAFDPKMPKLITWHPYIMLLGCCLAGVGLLLTWWGYRRWLVVDFD